MDDNLELVDLSLFAESPTNDHTFSTPDMSAQQHHVFPTHSTANRSQPLPRDYTNKPLPPLPSRRLRPRPRICAARGYDAESRCILKRIQRMASNDHSSGQADSLMHRRRPVSPPALTLSVPTSNPRNRGSTSAMIWMPEEQMWLIAGERQPENTDQTVEQEAYPSPPPYSPRGYTHSEPSPTIQPTFDLTPPLTPIQYQLQSLIQPPQRDEERFYPLFQQAMNSVPMLDPDELVLPSLSLTTNLTPGDGNPSQLLRPQSALERSASEVSPLSPIRPTRPIRSASTGSRLSHARSDTLDTQSFYSALSVDLTQPEHSANRWAGLASRIARSESAMG